MRTDFDKVEVITDAMRLNDRLYAEMRDELEDYLDAISDLCPEEFTDRFEELYFYRRVISVFENYDMPFKVAIGYLDLSNRLEILVGEHFRYIGDDDSDEAIFQYVIEFGYQFYDIVKM